MNNYEENKYSMYLAVKKYLDTQTAITNSIPNFSTTYALFTGGLTKIENNRNTQETNITGTTDNKADLKETLAKAAFDLSNKLKAYATVSKNSTLLKEVKTTLSVLRKLADSTLHDKATLLYNRAQSNIASLAGYNITAASQTAFNTLLGNYKSAIPAPRLSQTDKKEATKNVKAGIKDCDDALTTLDTLIEVVNITQPTFYSKYHTTRIVINLGGKRLALTGKATDSNGNPVANVGFKFSTTLTHDDDGTQSDIETTILKKTSKKGAFRLANLPAGTYQVTISKPGYKTLVLTHHQVEGEPGKLTVVLEAE